MIEPEPTPQEVALAGLAASGALDLAGGEVGFALWTPVGRVQGLACAARKYTEMRMSHAVVGRP